MSTRFRNFLDEERANLLSEHDQLVVAQPLDIFRALN
jgi:hypothetical protein